MVSNLSHIAYSYVDELQYIELCKFLYKEQRRKHMTQHILYDNHGREPVSELLTREEYRAFTDYVNSMAVRLDTRSMLLVKTLKLN